MPRYRIVVHDEEKAHEAHIHSYRLHPQIQRAMRKENKRRAVGTVHDENDSECPDGLPNCRNCGDPAHAETCQAAGHCPHCGTKHGIAPDAVLAANGYRLEPAQ